MKPCCHIWLLLPVLAINPPMERNLIIAIVPPNRNLGAYKLKLNEYKSTITLIDSDWIYITDLILFTPTFFISIKLIPHQNMTCAIGR